MNEQPMGGQPPRPEDGLELRMTLTSLIDQYGLGAIERELKNLRSASENENPVENRDSSLDQELKQIFSSKDLGYFVEVRLSDKDNVLGFSATKGGYEDFYQNSDFKNYLQGEPGSEPRMTPRNQLMKVLDRFRSDIPSDQRDSTLVGLLEENYDQKHNTVLALTYPSTRLDEYNRVAAESLIFSLTEEQKEQVFETLEENPNKALDIILESLDPALKQIASRPEFKRLMIKNILTNPLGEKTIQK